ncbi:response regulator [Lyngbya aestuarii BL J]|uniref:Response regulator n=1 Tax=Lyngbya aestuarii BL J TaxID=1348334 RepID=U7QC63_9CYAN|nr:response regulator [Lyngbya aestuarii]ERT05434.1 response regulator [Lyngbya aestuarii BL J]
MKNPRPKSSPVPYLLIVEDNDEDFEVFMRLMKTSNFSYPIYRFIDGDDILDFLFYQGEYADRQETATPALIIVDLNLPGTDGREVIAKIKEDPNLKIIPVVAFTTSSNHKDIKACYQNGVNSYIQKPLGISSYKKIIENFSFYWFNSVILPDYEE